MADFERRHYNAIAARIAPARRAVNSENELAAIAVVAALLADEFENDNPRFDRYRFLVACIGESRKVPA